MGGEEECLALVERSSHFNTIVSIVPIVSIALCGYPIKKWKLEISKVLKSKCLAFVQL